MLIIDRRQAAATNIEDVRLIGLRVLEDDRGYLFEIIDKSDEFFSGKGQELRLV